MPKQKTHSGAKKRFKVTGSGKIKRERTHKRHLLEHKSGESKLAKRGTVTVAPADVRRVTRLLGA